MSKQLYKNLNVNDFDKFDCVKLSLWFYFALVYSLRAYIVWLMSIANRGDSTSFISLIYPDPLLFYSGLFTGVLGIFILVVISLRRPNANAWIKKLWPKTKAFLFTTFIIDLVVNLLAYSIWDILELKWLIIQCAITLILIINAFKDERIELNLSEFPQEVAKP